MKAKIYYQPGTGKKISEDFYFIDFNGHRLKVAVGDWASNLVGGPYTHEETAVLRGEPADTKYNGGVIGSTLVKDVIERTDETGYKLIQLANERIRGAYEQLGIKGYRENRALTFTGYIAHAIVAPEKTVVTGVGDVRLAADSRILTGITKAIDTHHTELRKWCIENGSEDWFKKMLNAFIISQYETQNVLGHKFSYPAIDGTETLPQEGITFIEIPTPKNLLLWSDGFEEPDNQDGFTIEGLESKLKKVYNEDPQRCKNYPGLKGDRLDDRTAVHVEIDDWDSIRMDQI